MANPPTYTPGYSFSDFQDSNPVDPLPAPRLDDELQDISYALNGVRNGLLDIRRSDGALKNGIVTPDSLAPQFSIGFSFRGTWLDGVQYSAGDGVVANNAFYSARYSHLSSAGNAPVEGQSSETWNFLFSIDDLAVAGALSMPVADFSGDGVTQAFTLPFVPVSANNLLVSVGGVLQAVDQYSVSGDVITFATAPAAGFPIEVRGFASVSDLVTPSDGSVTTEKLADEAVTEAKLAPGLSDVIVSRYGLGVTALPPLLANLDDPAQATGFYRTTAATTGTFPGTTNVGMVLIERYAGSWAKQTFTYRADSTAGQRERDYTRSYNVTTSAWSAWERAARVIDTVSTFDTVAALQSATYLKSGQQVSTKGYVYAGDNGGNDYEVITPPSNVPIPAGNAPYVVIGSGQSNMVGLSTELGGTFPTNPNVYMWLATSDVAAPSWVQNPRLDTTQYWVPVGLTARPTIGGGQNTLSLSFAHRLASATGKPVYVIMDARGSQSIDNWIANGKASVRYDSLVIQIAAAWPSIPNSPTKAQYFLWQQGETDALAGDSAATHQANMETLYSQLITESWWASNTHFIAGQPSQTALALTNFAQINLAQTAFAAVNPALRHVASAAGLRTSTDDTHFQSQAIHELGYYRYWDSLSSVAIPDGGNYILLNNGLLARGLFPSGVANLKQFGATTESGNDDTRGWNAFQSHKGPKSIPAGSYRVDVPNAIAQARRFDNGTFGNGNVFSRLSDTQRAQVSVGIDNFPPYTASIVLADEATDAAIRPSLYVSNTITDSSGASAAAKVAGIYSYMEQTGRDTLQYPKAIAGTAINAAHGDNDATGVVGYGVKFDVPVSGNFPAGTGDVAASGGVAWQRSSQGGLVLGAEFAVHMATANTYTTGQAGSGNRTMNVHITSSSPGGPNYHGISFDSNGLNAGYYGFLSAIAFLRSTFGMGGEGIAAGTVGIDFQTNTTTGPEKAIALGNAGYHLWRNNALAIRMTAVSLDFDNTAGTPQIRLVSPTGADGQKRFGGYIGTLGPDGTSSLTVQGAFDIIAGGETRMTAYNAGSIQSSVACSATVNTFLPRSPGGSGTMALGHSTSLWSVVYASTGTINTSDERYKSDIENIPDAVLDAWGEVGFAQFRMNDAIAQKGDEARIHAGLIVQRVMEAFERHDVDPFRYGLVCYDEWDAEPEKVHVERFVKKHAVYEQVLVRDAVLDANGEIEKNAVYEDGELLEPEEYEEIETVIPGIEAGNRYSLRYEEALCVEAAYQRRRADRIEARLAAVEQIISQLSN